MKYVMNVVCKLGRHVAKHKNTVDTTSVSYPQITKVSPPPNNLLFKIFPLDTEFFGINQFSLRIVCRFGSQCRTDSGGCCPLFKAVEVVRFWWSVEIVYSVGRVKGVFLDNSWNTRKVCSKYSMYSRHCNHVWVHGSSVIVWVEFGAMHESNSSRSK